MGGSHGEPCPPLLPNSSLVPWPVLMGWVYWGPQTMKVVREEGVPDYEGTTAEPSG